MERRAISVDVSTKQKVDSLSERWGLTRQELLANILDIVVERDINPTDKKGISSEALLNKTASTIQEEFGELRDYMDRIEARIEHRMEEQKANNLGALAQLLERYKSVIEQQLTAGPKVMEELTQQVVKSSKEHQQAMEIQAETIKSLMTDNTKAFREAVKSMDDRFARFTKFQEKQIMLPLSKKVSDLLNMFSVDKASHLITQEQFYSYIKGYADTYIELADHIKENNKALQANQQQMKTFTSDMEVFHTIAQSTRSAAKKG